MGYLVDPETQKKAPPPTSVRPFEFNVFVMHAPLLAIPEGRVGNPKASKNAPEGRRRGERKEKKWQINPIYTGTRPRPLLKKKSALSTHCAHIPFLTAPVPQCACAGCQAL